MSIPTLQPGKPLVIVGCQGAGKPSLARRIAAAAGTYIEIHGVHDAAILSAARRQITTVIIEEAPLDQRTLGLLKRYITRGSIRAHEASERTKEYRAPNFILISSHDPSTLFDEPQSRRFTVVRVGKEAAHG